VSPLFEQRLHSFSDWLVIVDTENQKAV
jgi:hypothetical protein